MLSWFRGWFWYAENAVWWRFVSVMMYMSFCIVHYVLFILYRSIIERLLHAIHCAQCRRDSFGAVKSDSIARQAAPGVRVRRSHRVLRKTATLEAREDLQDMVHLSEESLDTKTEDEYSPGERPQPWRWLIWNVNMGKWVEKGSTIFGMEIQLCKSTILQHWYNFWHGFIAFQCWYTSTIIVCIFHIKFWIETMHVVLGSLTSHCLHIQLVIC